MSRKRRTRRSTSAYTALAQFARAYLHEDFIAEYGGAVDAARAFRAAATAAECRELAAELTRLAESSSDWPQAQLAAFITGDLGGAWANPSSSALRQMASVISGSTGE